MNRNHAIVSNNAKIEGEAVIYIGASVATRIDWINLDQLVAARKRSIEKTKRRASLPLWSKFDIWFSIHILGYPKKIVESVYGI